MYRIKCSYGQMPSYKTQLWDIKAKEGKKSYLAEIGRECSKTLGGADGKSPGLPAV